MAGRSFVRPQTHPSKCVSDTSVGLHFDLKSKVSALVVGYAARATKIKKAAKMSESWDPTWYDYDRLRYEDEIYWKQPYPQQKKLQVTLPPQTIADIVQLKQKLISQAQTLKETPPMGTNFSDNDQYMIDNAVREAIEKPRREAEIALRVGAVQTLSPMLEDADPGTVIRFVRTYSKRPYTYAAIKVVRSENEEPVWYVTGSAATRADTYTTETLLRWMTTGDSLVSDVQIATEFADVTWTPVVPVVDETTA